jgi:CubicO group peptidase (beta-lactamase class C family)
MFKSLSLGGGWTGTNFWIDPTTGVAGVMGIQMLSITSGAFDPDLLKAFAAFEETLYSALA